MGTHICWYGCWGWQPIPSRPLFLRFHQSFLRAAEGLGQLFSILVKVIHFFSFAEQARSPVSQRIAFRMREGTRVGHLDSKPSLAHLLVFLALFSFIRYVVPSGWTRGCIKRKVPTTDRAIAYNVFQSAECFWTEKGWLFVQLGCICWDAGCCHVLLMWARQASRAHALPVRAWWAYVRPFPSFPIDAVCAHVRHVQMC